MKKVVNDLDKLKDIKPPVEITGYSYNELFMIVGATILALVLVALIVYLFTKRHKKRVKLTREQKALKALKELKIEPSKEMLYTFSENAKIVTKDEDKKARLEKILQKLEAFKYNPNAPKPSNEILQEIREFIKDIK